jgi:hypothetical protein
MPKHPKVVGSPTKSLFLQALTSDIDLADAVSDLVDNSVDAARRYRSDGNYEGLEVRIAFDQTHFQIRDNCGGIDLQTAEKVLFSLGRPANYQSTPGQIGRFGIGMKRDLFMMGNEITVESATKNSRFKIDIDLREWASRKDWDFKFSEYEENVHVPATEIGTRITVGKLRETVANEYSLPLFTETLIGTLQKKQKQALQHHLAIFVATTRLTTQPYKLKFLAEHIEPAFFGREFNGGGNPLQVKIVAGIEDSKPAEAGWYVSCNGRFVLVADQSSKTVWGEEGKVSVPKMHHQFARFRGYVFFECQDPVRLPWNSTKTGLNTDSNIYRQVRELMTSATRPVIDFLNKLDGEKELDERPLEKAVENAESRPVTTLLETLKPNSNFKYKGLKGDFDPDQPIRISYVKPLGQVQLARRKLGVETNREVGSGTFEYYFTHELRKRG